MAHEQHRTLQIVRDHLAQPGAALGADALARAVRQETPYGQVVRELANDVGGLDHLEALDSHPVPDEAFDWSVVSALDRPFVEQVLVLVDASCDRWLDVEYRTIARRLLARVIAHDPAPIRRSSRPERIAAGIVLAVLDGNGAIGSGRRWRAGDVGLWLGTSSPGDVARRLVAAACFGLAYDENDGWGSYRKGIRLPSAELLHSRWRRALIERRERARALVEDEERLRAGRRPVVHLGDGRIQLRACPADVAFAHKARSASGQITIAISFVPVQPDPELTVFALTVPEAHRLALLLEEVFAEPAPSFSEY